ncbi:MAG: Uma2 family endonuclease [Actinomycetota bacterium]|nr:Uma2 family endonuclease [Actinomycetota bacterium]
MATTVRQRMRVDEFAAMSEGDPRPMELIDGEVVVMSHPRRAHALLQARLIGEIGGWGGKDPGRPEAHGPTAVELTEYDHYGPDIVVARSGAPVDDRGYLAEPPLICVEIRSPSTWRYDVGRKKSVYEAQGVGEVWLVDDIAEVILVFRRSTPAQATYDVALELATSDTLTSPLLAGFALPLARLF